DGYPARWPDAWFAVRVNRARMWFDEITVAAFARRLENELASPVTDATHLDGAYRIDLKWIRRRDPKGPATSRASDLAKALEQQLGLELRKLPGPVEMLVIERASFAADGQAH